MPGRGRVCRSAADRDGRPSARTVLLKGADADGFRFFTNTESRKGRELAENPHGALVFHWRTEPRRQVTVAGRVAQLPSQGSGLYLEHEAIDNYVARSGKVEGMDSMTMPFPVAKGVSLEDIQPDDIVEVQLHIDWAADDRQVEITAVRELPRDTRLDFRLAQPPKQP
mgnify:CR=1 FL=1